MTSRSHLNRFSIKTSENAGVFCSKMYPHKQVPGGGEGEGWLGETDQVRYVHNMYIAMFIAILTTVT